MIIAKHVAEAFADHSLDVFQEVPLGSSIIGKERRADLLVLAKSTGQAVALQAKFQTVPGTTDEKIHYALADCAAMWIPAVVVYGGSGWSVGVRHTLEASRHAVRCEVDGSGVVTDSSELDAFLASIFKVWDVIVAGRTPVAAAPRKKS